MTNWNIENLTPELQQKWEKKGFTAEETKEWIEDFKLKPEEADFADWLKKKYNITTEEYLGDDDMENLRKKYKEALKKGSEELEEEEKPSEKYQKKDINITELHLEEKEGEIDLRDEKFSKLERIYYNKKINIVSNWDIWLAKLLKKPQPEGLKISHYHYAELLSYTPIKDKLDELYPGERKNITKLNLSKQGLRGKLDLSTFPNLEELEIELSYPPITKHFTSNYINDLNLSENKKLKKITLINSPVKLNLNIFKDLGNLEMLNIPGGNWVGSLESLKVLPLTKLDISYNSEITGWEHFPSTITDLNCKGTSFYKKIKPFAFDMEAWKLVKKPELVNENNEAVLKEITNKLAQSSKTIKELNKIGLTNDSLESQIEILQTKQQEMLNSN